MIINSVKKSLIPYTLILLFWITISFFIDFWTDLYDALLLLTIGALICSFMFIVYKIVINNKKDISKMFINLSKLPFLILASHIAVMISGTTFGDKGRWWVLYILLVICPTLSIILFTTGLTIKYFKKNKINEQSYTALSHESCRSVKVTLPNSTT